MKMSPEKRTAIGLKKEYDIFAKYAARPGAPKIEAEYYTNLANLTYGKIQWKHLENKKVKEFVENEDYEQFDF